MHRYRFPTTFDTSAFNLFNLTVVILSILGGVLWRSSFWSGFAVFEIMYLVLLTVVRNVWKRELDIDDTRMVYRSKFGVLHWRETTLDWDRVTLIQLFPYFTFTWPEWRVVMGKEPSVKVLRVTAEGLKEPFSESISIFNKDHEILQILKDICEKKGIKYTQSWK